LVDVERNLHLSVKTLDSCQERARAVVVPHLYGLCAPVREIGEWSKKAGLYLIDDAAQGAGISIDGKYLGTFGDFGILSFGPFKSLSTPRGGALISEDSEIIAKSRNEILKHESFYWPIRRILGGFIKFHLRPYYLGMNDLRHENIRTTSSSNQLNEIPTMDEGFQLSNIEAQLVHSVLGRTCSIVTNRRRTAYEIWRLLEKFETFEFVGPNNAPYVKIPIRLHGGLGAEEAVKRFRSMQIEAERIYRPLHFFNEYRDYGAKSLPSAEESWKRVFLIPNPVTGVKFGINRLAQAFEVLSKI